VYSTQLASLAYEDSESEDDETDEVKKLKLKIFLKIVIFQKIVLYFCIILSLRGLFGLLFEIR
jgi:hypothetical protein